MTAPFSFSLPTSHANDNHILTPDQRVIQPIDEIIQDDHDHIDNIQQDQMDQDQIENSHDNIDIDLDVDDSANVDADLNRVEQEMEEDDDEFVQAAFETFLDLNQRLQSTSGLDTIVTTANSFGEIQPHPAGPSRQQHAALVNQSLHRFLGVLEQRINQVTSGSLTQNSLIDNFHILKCMAALYFSSTLHNPTRSELTYHLLLPVMEWVNIMDPRPTLDETTDVMEYNAPSQHPYFWSYIYTLACRGLFKQCSNSLSHAGLTATPETTRIIALVVQLLDSYPLDNLNSLVFRQWHSSAIVATDVLMNDCPAMDPTLKLQFKTLFEILKGTATVIADNTTTWPDAMVARLMYDDPTDASIGDHYKWAEDLYPSDMTDNVAVACSYLFEGRILDAIRICKGGEEEEEEDGDNKRSTNSANTSSQLVAAYMANYCDLRGLLDTYDTQSERRGGAVRDWLIMDHAKRCLLKQELAPIGVYLLEYIITESDELDSPDAADAVQECRDTIASYLPTHAFSSVSAITWALAICERLQLTKTQVAIYQKRAENLVKDDYLLDAIITYERAGQLAQVRHYAWELLERSLISGNPNKDNLLKAVVDNDDPHSLDSGIEISSTVRDCLAPYAVWCQFLNKATSDTLLALIKFPYLSAKYIPLLVCNAVGVLADMDVAGLATLVGALDTNTTSEGLELVSRASLVDRSTLPRHDWRLDLRLVLAKGAEDILMQVRLLVAKAVANAYT